MGKASKWSNLLGFQWVEVNIGLEGVAPLVIQSLYLEALQQPLRSILKLWMLKWSIR